jgi:hypothetical protein
MFNHNRLEYQEHCRIDSRYTTEKVSISKFRHLLASSTSYEVLLVLSLQSSTCTSTTIPVNKSATTLYRTRRPVLSAMYFEVQVLLVLGVLPPILGPRLPVQYLRYVLVQSSKLVIGVLGSISTIRYSRVQVQYKYRTSKYEVQMQVNVLVLSIVQVHHLRTSTLLSEYRKSVLVHD